MCDVNMNKPKQAKLQVSTNGNSQYPFPPSENRLVKYLDINVCLVQNTHCAYCDNLHYSYYFLDTEHFFF